MRVKGDHQKLKLLYLAQIFERETDDDHGLTLPEIAERLQAAGVNADRKTLYQDFEELRTFGMDILGVREGRETRYRLGAREFELSELKLLVDSVESAKFITDGKSRELIGKLEKLTSRYLATQLKRQVVISGRVKSMNESIYYNVDTLHQAIGGNMQIRFHYFQWNMKKEMQLRRDGAWYQISPWALIRNSENYYLIGYDAGDRSKEDGGRDREDGASGRERGNRDRIKGERAKTQDPAGKIKHYRVDKMLDIEETGLPRLGGEQFASFDLARYSQALFGMFGGEETRVTLEADSDMAGTLIDRFGKDLILVRTDEDHFRTAVNVAVSSQFFGWIMGLGGKVRITGPDYVREKMGEEARKIAAQYD